MKKYPDQPVGWFLMFCMLLVTLSNQAQQRSGVLTVPSGRPVQQQVTATPPSFTDSSQTKRVSDESTVLNLNMVVAVPDGQFYDVSNGNFGYGLSGYVAYNPLHHILHSDLIRPFLIGFQFEYIWFDTRSKTYRQQNTFGWERVTSRVTNKAIAGGIVGRTEFISQKIYPFIEYNAGLRFFSGGQTVNYDGDQSNGYQTGEVSRNLEWDVAGYYGFGGGLGYRSGNLRIELKLGYQRGGNARYIDPESITFNQGDNSISYRTKKSATDMFLPQLGISFYL